MRRNSNQTAHLEAEVLKRIRVAQGVSRADLAKDLGLSGSTAGVYVERLLEEGFLTEAAQPRDHSGRPPKLLHLNPHGGEFVGVDFEARNIMAVAVDFTERPLRHAHVSIEERDSPAQIQQKIFHAISAVLPQDRSRLLSIGVGVPGVVDAAKGISVRYEYLPQWQNVPLAELCKQRFKVPVFLENTMRAMALAELWFGQGRGCSDFVCICIRSGMGAGIVANGQLLRGTGGLAGELGHWRSASPTPDAAADLQSIVSARSIQIALQNAIASGAKTTLSGLGHAPRLEDVVSAAQRKDPLTMKVLAHVAGALGSALAHLALTLNPQKLILAGQLTPLGDTLLQPVRLAVTEQLRTSGIPPAEIVNSTMGEYVGALGAAALALHEWRPSQT